MTIDDLNTMRERALHAAALALEVELFADKHFNTNSRISIHAARGHAQMLATVEAIDEERKRIS